MQTEVEKLNSYMKKLRVDISPEELIPLEEKVVRNYQRRADIPGFRKGKAPLNLIRQRNKEFIQQDLIEEAIHQFYSKALNEADINPVSEGKITQFNFENVDSGMLLEIEIEVEPEVELKKYKGLTVEKETVQLTEEMVDDAIEHLREQYATVREVEEAKEDHYIHFEAQELDKGDVPIVGHKYENLQVKLGSGEFDSDIEQQLIGVKTGEKRIVRKEIPPPPDKKDKNPDIQSLQIYVKKIEEKEFPELDEDFVKNLDDENLEKLDQLRERIRQNMQLDFQQRSERTLRNRIIDELLKENPFNVPPSMVENYLNEMINEIQSQSKDRTIDQEAVRKEYRVSAVHNIRWYFLKKKLAEEENLSISDEEVFRLIEESNLDDKIKKQAKLDRQYIGRLKEDLLENKILEFLKEHADVTEVYPVNK
ncbi:MAG: trigger factor [Calditrichaeota bacterium]|nr:trigger factor [Calditrichota bacterium]RQW02875.1 MAG: trigger factor [Calditrichota bacterium]